jgi:hypothetical protein
LHLYFVQIWVFNRFRIYHETLSGTIPLRVSQ